MSISVDQEYNEERTCIYKGRQYRVRNNGAVMRVPRDDKNPGKNDNRWTFGEMDKAGYLTLAGVRVHMIVAQAFHGEKQSKNLIIDHIDTIKVNNRPSNLHYVTRFENIVDNPLTRAKIESVTGLPIEKILEDLSVLHNFHLPPSLSWVKSVSQREADILRSKMEAKLLSNEYTHGIQSKQAYAFQADGWWPLGVFPFCPTSRDSSLEDYASNIKIGRPFFFHSYRSYITDEFAISADGKTLAVKCSDLDAVKKYILITVNINPYNVFIHRCNRFFESVSLEKYYTLALGKTWNGGDVFDDYA